MMGLNSVRGTQEQGFLMVESPMREACIQQKREKAIGTSSD